MKVIIKSKTTMNTIEYDNVTSISYASNTFTIVHGGVTTTFSSTDYFVALMLM